MVSALLQDNVNIGKALMVTVMAIQLVACVCYALAGDVRRSVYNGAAVVILASVTF